MSLMIRAALASLLCLAGCGAALAHHPGSHASRDAKGMVKLDAVATVTESCLAIASVENVPPPRVAAPPAVAPVTVRLRRGEGACAQKPTVLRATRNLEIAAPINQLQVYIVSPDGSVLATERVPLR